MPARHFLQNFIEFGVLELNHGFALFANHVIVCRIAIIVIENRVGAEFDATQQSSIDELGQGAIDGRTAHAATRFLEFINELIGLKVRMFREDMFDELPLLLREPLRLRPAR